MSKLYCHTECGKWRNTNEDVETFNLNLSNFELKNKSQSHTFNPNLAPIDFLLLCDGHGGIETAKFIAPQLERFFMNIEHHYPMSDQVIFDFFNALQNQIVNHANLIGYSGSTALIVIRYLSHRLFGQSHLQVINLGDCRAVLSNNGLAIPLTIDHKPMWPREQHRIQYLSEKQGAPNPIRNVRGCWRVGNLSVSRSFGDLHSAPYVTHIPEVFNYVLNDNNEFLILACDGIWDVMDSQEAINLVFDTLINNHNSVYDNEDFSFAKSKSRAFKNGIINASKVLTEYGYAKGSQDNISVMIYLLK